MKEWMEVDVFERESVDDGRGRNPIAHWMLCFHAEATHPLTLKLEAHSPTKHQCASTARCTAGHRSPPTDANSQ